MRSAMPIVSLVAVVLGAGCGNDGGGGATEAGFEGKPWALVSGVGLPAGAAAFGPSATFTDGTVAGSTGCNQFTSTYTLDGDSLEIGQIASTRMACAPPADQVERRYLAALARVARWRMDGEQLVLADGEDAELLRYGSATPAGSWLVTALLTGDAVSSPILGTELTADFGSDGSLTGSAGCNTYTGSYTTDGDAIDIEPPAATEKACAEPAGVMDQESAYLALLPTAVRYSVDGSVLKLLSEQGTTLVTYTRGN